jgi:hypothetical protein
MPGAVPKAELVVRNTNIITMDPRQPRAHALAVQPGRSIPVGAPVLVLRPTSLATPPSLPAYLPRVR